jgi:hypothetical protein
VMMMMIIIMIMMMVVVVIRGMYVFLSSWQSLSSSLLDPVLSQFCAPHLPPTPTV